MKGSPPALTTARSTTTMAITRTTAVRSLDPCPQLHCWQSNASAAVTADWGQTPMPGRLFTSLCHKRSQLSDYDKLAPSSCRVTLTLTLNLEPDVIVP